MPFIPNSRQRSRQLAHFSVITFLAFALGFGPGTAAAASLWSPTSTPSSSPTPTATAVPVVGEIVIQPRYGTTIAALNTRYQTTTLFQFTDSTAALVQTSDLNGTLAALANDRSVDWFEANNTARQPAAKDDSGADPYCGTTAVVAPTNGTSSQDDSGADPYCTHVIANGAAEYADQWADVKINLGWAQKRVQGQGVTIAVLDTEVETTHPALAGKLLPGLDLVPLDPQTNVATTGTKRGHRTFVAGVALHVAPAAKVLPVHVLNEDGRGSTALVAEGIRQAAKNHAQVINLSLSTPTPSRALQEAVAYAQGLNSVLVAAYGNEGVRNPEVYPADFPNALSVVATDDSDLRAPFTNFGRKADVAAPGVAIVGPWRDGTYGVGSGTSYATPIVSGEVALLIAAGRAGRQSDAQPRIIAATDNIDRLNGMPMGFGRINLPAALMSR